MFSLDLQQIIYRLEQLSQIGSDNNGGTTRLSYSTEYEQGMNLIREYFQQAGMTVNVDAVGNVIGTYKGNNEELPVVWSGSHLDTVPNGGRFDGALGIICAIECINSWHKAGWRPARTVQIIATIEEEGNQFGMCLGTRAIAGMLNNIDPHQISNNDGVSLAEKLQQLSLDSRNIAQARQDPNKIHCFLELHIEQGEELDLLNLPCGIVTDIVGIHRQWLTITGKSNHAGTTRMDRRKDALVAASHLNSEIYRNALNANGRYVATVGTMRVSPGVINIVPGQVIMPLEIRYIADQDLETAQQFFREAVNNVSRDFQVEISMDPISHTDPVQLNKNVISVLEQAAQHINIPYKNLPSWAGHDAQILASIAPAAMIFVPSVQGISHSPLEFSRQQDIYMCTKLLLEALTRLADN